MSQDIVVKGRCVVNTNIVLLPDRVEPEHGGEVDELADEAGGDAQPRAVAREFIGQLEDGQQDVEDEEHAYLHQVSPIL